MSTSRNAPGYVLMAETGENYAFGAVRSQGNPTGFTGRIVGISATSDGQGYAVVSSAGQVYAYGVPYWGNATGFSGQIVGISLTADGQGYYLVSSTGQVFAFHARYWDNPEGFSGQITGISGRADGQGYYVLSSTGQVYAFNMTSFGNGDPGPGGVTGPGEGTTPAPAPAGPVSNARTVMQSAADAEARRGFKETNHNNVNPYGPTGPWCAMFLKWVWARAQVAVTGTGTDNVGNLYNWVSSVGRARGATDTPVFGDAVFYDEPYTVGVWNHVGLVDRVNPDGTIVTVEGNVGDAVPKALVAGVAISRTWS